MKLRKTLGLLLIAALTATAVTGCKKTTEPNPSESVTQSASVEKVTGGEVVVGIQQDVDSLDPHVAVAAGTKEILFNVFEGLVMPTEDGSVAPAVASGYVVSEDGLTYTFTIRDGIKFSDGRAVTAEDVKYSIERCAGILDGTPLVAALSTVSHVDIVDQSTVNIVLSEANLEIIYYLNAEIIPANSDKNGDMVGTGPFKLDSYNPQESVVLSRNENYWQNGLPYLDKVTFKIVASAESAMIELKAGSIDVYPYLTDDQALELADSFNIAGNGSSVVQALFINNVVAPFDNVKVRQALCYAIDSDTINDMVFGGKAEKIGTSMLPGQEVYVEGLEYGHDVEKAKALLSEAGYANGFDMEITVPSNYQMHMDTAQIMVENLKEVGITAKINAVDWSTWLDDTYKGRNFQTTVCGITGKLTPSYLLVRYQSDAGNNFINYNNPKYDELYKKIAVTLDENELKEGYRTLEKYLAEDAACVFNLVPPVLIALDKKLDGYKFYPIYVQDMKSVYWTK